MISNFVRPSLLAACIAACLAATAATQAAHAAAASALAAREQAAANANGNTYIVMFSEPSVALRNRALRTNNAKSLTAGAGGHANANAQSGAAIPFVVKPNGRAAMDMRSDVAQNYRASLVAAQTQHQRSIEAALGRSVSFARTYQYAINGATLVLSNKEADLVRAIPGVISVVPSRTLYPDDDVSSRFVGADVLWRGNSRRPPSPGFTYPTLDSLFGDLDQNAGFKGDGVVIGVIDTGYNSQSPSFQATDGSGYTVANPLGAGNYIGDCGVSGISFGGCNDKVIGVYDENNRSQNKAAVTVEDVVGHGSHTASTAGGNARSGGFPGFTANLSGIAPHANLSIFAIQAPGASTATGAAQLGAIEDAIKDGVVDVLNMSFGGCSEPSYWSDPVSLGFLAAQEANIFAALSAGNTRPVTQCARQAAQTPGTLGNAMPWVTTVAASTPPAGQANLQLSITGPGTPPASTQAISMTEGTYDTQLTASLPATTPIVLSPQFDAGDPGSSKAPSHGADGCSSYPPNIFQNSIALISRGTCAFAVKVPNAIAAGAIAVVISDNRAEGPFSPTVGPPTVGVPVFSSSQADGLALQAFLAAKSNQGTASMGYPSARPAAQGDVLASFSLLGPVLTPVPFDVVKPDIAAPGVGTLAAYSNATASSSGHITSNNNPGIVAFDSGTSMASPHIAGAAALLVQAHPDWTAAEIKSALMMTSVRSGVTKADGVTPADIYDVGSGRVQVARAASAGLVLDEVGKNFLTADPTQGGDLSSLNIASMQNFSCAGTCSFTRTFRSTQTTAVTWQANAVGALANSITIAPSSFTVPAGGTVSVTFTVDARQLPAGGAFSSADVILSPPTLLPAYQPLADLHLPISVAAPAPALVASANVVNIGLGGKATGSATLGFWNVGGGQMVFAPQRSGAASFSWINQADDFGYDGWTSVHYLNPGSGDVDYYSADDFTVSGSNVSLGTITVTGQTAAHNLASFGASLPIHWRIYADNGGQPAGSPVSGASGAAAVWSYDATAGSPGVSVAGDGIALDLAAAGATTALNAGTYWLSVYVDLPCNDKGDGNGCSEAWYWNNSWYNSGSTWSQYNTGSSAWGAGYAGTGSGLSMSITTNVTCGGVPNWLTLTPNGGAGAVTAATPATVNFTAAAAGYAPSTSASTYVCFSSGYVEPSTQLTIPKAVVPVQVNAQN